MNQHRTLEQQEKGKKELALQKKVQHLKDTYADWIKQFYEIAERKVSLRDDYGDENWDVLEKEIQILILKIAKIDFDFSVSVSPHCFL